MKEMEVYILSYLVFLYSRAISVAYFIGIVRRKRPPKAEEKNTRPNGGCYNLLSLNLEYSQFLKLQIRINGMPFFYKVNSF